MKKRGQIGVEVVIYTLIALSLIGAVLAFTIPKIEEIRDRAVIEQSVVMMENIDNKISSLSLVPGNKRVVDITIKKGTFIISGENNSIKFEMESEFVYSEPGTEINLAGNLVALTEKVGSANKVTLTRTFNNYDLTYNNENSTKLLSQSPTPYKLSIENRGNSVINFAVS